MIAGVDEAGRGALAGPVTAAAVMLDGRCPDAGLNDSKQLSPSRRKRIEEQIKQNAVAWALGWGSVAEINTHNILNASLLAMRRAIAALEPTPSAAWVDGNRAPHGIGVCRTVVGGDGLQPGISAASILAKVARDRWMLELDARHPGYDLAASKGYGTAAHRWALAELGPIAAHRAHFAPVARSRAARQAGFVDF